MSTRRYSMTAVLAWMGLLNRAIIIATNSSIDGTWARSFLQGSYRLGSGYWPYIVCASISIIHCFFLFSSDFIL